MPRKSSGLDISLKSFDECISTRLKPTIPLQIIYREYFISYPMHSYILFCRYLCREISSADTMTSSGLASRRTVRTNYEIQPFGFHSKTAYDATESILNQRNDNFRIKPPLRDNDIWKRPPPDFSPQNFRARPPKRNSRDAMRPERFHSRHDDSVRESQSSVALPHILRTKPPSTPQLETVFNISGSWEAKLEYAKEGINKAGLYENPAPHDYRQVGII